MKILAEGLEFPEGPAFTENGDLWFVEMQAGNLVRYCNGELRRYPLGGEPNGLTFDSDGCAWICDAGRNAILRFITTTAKWDTIVTEIGGEPLAKPNDLAFDPNGNLIFTCPGDSRSEPSGYVCCLTRDGVLSEIAEGLYFPNGLVFLEGGRWLAIAETFRQRIWKGRWDRDNARWIDPEPLAHINTPIGPDGMATDEDGLLYVAAYGAGCVVTLDPSGRCVGSISVPGMKPTNVAFDPTDRLGLVVTEAERGLLLSLAKGRPGVPLLQGGRTW